MCQVLGVSKSGFYSWVDRPISQQKRRREKLTAHIKRVYVESEKRYGSPKITRTLNREGLSVSQKTVTRVMKENGIRSKIIKKYKATTNSNHTYPVYPNLLNQQFQTDKPGSVWVTDITYIWTKEGWLYLATVMDLFSRRIIGWQMSDRMTKQLTITALKRAINHQKPQEGLIHHSDRGSQYAAYAYQGVLRKHKITTSMSRKGNCYDNACIESFHSILKRELVFHRKYRTRLEAKRDISSYIMSFYNYKRIHSSTDYMSPVAYEKRYYRTLQSSR